IRCVSRGTFRPLPDGRPAVAARKLPSTPGFSRVYTLWNKLCTHAATAVDPYPPSSASQGATMRWKTSIGLLILGLILQGPVAPDALAGVPSEQLRLSVDQALKVLGDGVAKREHPRERRATLRKIADDIFDWDETAKRSLGMHWQQRTPAEREEFVRLFAERLEKWYMWKT